MYADDSSTTDVLNRLEPSYVRAKDAGNSSSKKDPRKLAENARHLSKYIFARQYGLNSPFSSAPAYGFVMIDYMDREAEIKVGILWLCCIIILTLTGQRTL